MTADAPTRQFLPSTTSGPITACGPTTVPVPMRACGSTCAVGSIRASSCTASTSSASATSCPPTSAAARARTSGPRRRSSVTSSLRRSPGTTCFRNFALSTPRSVTRPVGSSSEATCVSDSIIKTAGISGVPGKCPWKNSSLTVTFLIATIRRPGSCSAMSSTRSEGYREERRSTALEIGKVRALMLSGASYKLQVTSSEPFELPELGTCNLELGTLLRRWLDGVQFLDDVEGDVEPLVGPDDARVLRVDDEVEALLLAHLPQDRLDALLELLHQLVLQVLNLLLRVLGKALNLGLQP